MTGVVIRRKKDTAALGVPVDVYVDDELVATVRRGQKHIVELARGPHAVHARTEHYGSDVLDIDVDATDAVDIDVWLSMLSLWTATHQPHRTISIAVRGATVADRRQIDPVHGRTVSPSSPTWLKIKLTLAVVMIGFGVFSVIVQGLLVSSAPSIGGLIWGSVFALVGVLTIVSTMRQLRERRETSS